MLDPPVKIEPFAEETLEKRMARLCLQEETELDNYIALLKKMIKELGPQDLCPGFSVDGDMAVSLEDYFTQRRMEKSVCTPNCVEEPGWCNFHTGNIRVHLQELGGRSVVLKILSVFPCRRPRVVLLHGAVGRGVQRRCERRETRWRRDPRVPGDDIG